MEAEDIKLIDESVKHEPLEKKFIFAAVGLSIILLITFISSLGGGPSSFRNGDQLNPSLLQPKGEVAGTKTDSFGVADPPANAVNSDAPEKAAPTDAPKPTATSAPTATNAPAPTSSPTNTPQPTATPEPTATQTPTPPPTPTE